MASIWEIMANYPDVLKSFGSGVAQGTGAIAGIPGDIRQGFNGVVDPLLDKLDRAVGYRTPERVEPAYNIMPTSAQVRDQLSALDYGPQTYGGQYAKAVGETVPTAALGWPLMARAQGSKGLAEAAKALADSGYQLDPMVLALLGGSAAAVPAAVSASKWRPE